jgi:1-acyl-sn-glycerol-3-phosphate acyltransferase
MDTAEGARRVGWHMRTLYRRLVLLVVRVLTLTYCRRYEAAGREHMPPSGGVIVVSNHLNNADPPMVQQALPRPVVFMAKKEMIDAPIIGALFRAWGAFPVRRGEADLAAVRAACAVVQRGEVLMMFPEGTRSRTGHLGAGHPGTALIARRTGAPIVPVAITGTERIAWPGIFFRPRSVPRIRVVVGEPFVLEKAPASSETLRRDVDEIMARIAALLPEQYRAPETAARRDAI